MKKTLLLTLTIYSFIIGYLKSAEISAPGVYRTDNDQLKNEDIKKTILGNGVVWFVKTAAAPQSGQYEAYIQLHPGSKPISFYRYDRFITPILSHNKKYILILDYPASKAENDYVEDLRTKKIWRVNKDAVIHYEKAYAQAYKYFKTQNSDLVKTNPMNYGKNGPGFYIGGDVKGFSPDDTQILFHYVVGQFGGWNGTFNVGKYLPDRSYVVETNTGKVIKEYETSKLPVHWWVETQ